MTQKATRDLAAELNRKEKNHHPLRRMHVYSSIPGSIPTGFCHICRSRVVGYANDQAKGFLTHCRTGLVARLHKPHQDPVNEKFIFYVLLSDEHSFNDNATVVFVTGK